MTRSVYVVSIVFGVAGFIFFGTWGSVTCEMIWTDRPLNCGWIFITLAPIGFLAGFVVSCVVFLLMKVMVHFLRMPIVKLVQRLPGSKNSPIG